MGDVDASVWSTLMSRARIGFDGTVSTPTARVAARSDFERDWDRILFCAAFRRMHDKTQVFPLPDDDVIHSRLTHSLEVASVGRTLGKLTGQTVCQRHAIPDEAFDFHEVGDVVAAACLAHDIGNPPFGHAGEDAIGSYFRSEPGKLAIAKLTPRQKEDLEAFEGNAQGFRLLTKLQQEADGGLRLTAATLAAFCKYPRESGADLKEQGVACTKKHGAFQEDMSVLEVVANTTGMRSRENPLGRSWSRHPLAYLVEAADDFCYSILDIEDGTRLGLVRQERAEELLIPIAQKAEAFSHQRLASLGEAKKGRLGYLRAIAIAQLVDEASQCFLDSESAIVAGGFDRSLAKSIPSAAELAALQDYAKAQCYSAPDVLEIELAGYEALGGLLRRFVEAVTVDESERESSKRIRSAYSLLAKRGGGVNVEDAYSRILRVTDYVSGMTDRHALVTFRRLHGIAVPGRAG